MGVVGAETPWRKAGGSRGRGGGRGQGSCGEAGSRLQGARQLTAVGGLVTAIHTVIVAVTHPDSWDAALGDGALELVGGTGHLGCGAGEKMRTRLFCLPPHLKNTIFSLSQALPALPQALPAISWEEGTVYFQF